MVKSVSFTFSLSKQRDPRHGKIMHSPSSFSSRRSTGPSNPAYFASREGNVILVAREEEGLLS